MQRPATFQRRAVIAGVGAGALLAPLRTVAAAAGSDAVRGFRIEVPQDKIDAILGRVHGFDWAGYADPQDAGDWRLGPPAAWVAALCRYWTTAYDWRAQEAAMNAVPHFRAVIDDIDLHLVHERGSGPSPRPLLLVHGWPYSFHSYTALIDRLAHPERHGGRVEDAFSVVVPSLPGYDFSARPGRPMGPAAMASLLERLMRERLGYDRYVVHGGDWGNIVATRMALDHPAHVAGLHQTMQTLRRAGAPAATGRLGPDASSEERAYVASEAAIAEREFAYMQLQATKPAKLAFAMTDSPVGVAAWIAEAFHAWTDRRKRPFEAIVTRDQLLTEIMLYLVTDAFATSTWIYAGQEGEPKTLSPGTRVRVPSAFLAFPDPVFPMPPRGVVALTHDVVRYTVPTEGGHFPFYEAPEVLVDDLRAFNRQLGR